MAGVGRVRASAPVIGAAARMRTRGGAERWGLTALTALALVACSPSPETAQVPPGTALPDPMNAQRNVMTYGTHDVTRVGSTSRYVSTYSPAGVLMSVVEYELYRAESGEIASSVRSASAAVHQRGSGAFVRRGTLSASEPLRLEANEWAQIGATQYLAGSAGGTIAIDGRAIRADGLDTIVLGPLPLDGP